MTVKVDCYYCEAPVTLGKDDAYRRVTGWEKPRSAGGTNALSGRVPLDEWAHKRCIDKHSSGMQDQSSFDMG